MTIITPSPFPPHPVPPPKREQTPSEFNKNKDAHLNYLLTFPENVDAANTATYLNALDAKNSAASAGQSAIAAELSAQDAAQSATIALNTISIELFVPGKTYAQWDMTRSNVNGRAYTRQTAGASATDPANDAINWKENVPSQTELNRANFTRIAAQGEFLQINKKNRIAAGVTLVKIPARATMMAGDEIVISRKGGLKGLTIEFTENTYFNEVLVNSKQITWDTKSFRLTMTLCEVNLSGYDYWEAQ